MLFLCVFDSQATTWSQARPYIQKTEGQDVEIRAKAYEPYVSEPFGETEVYYKGKLLYTLDRYYRHKLFTSDDGTYLVFVTTNNYAGLSSVTYFGQNWIYHAKPAIAIYKNGILVKNYELKDVIDTASLLNDGVLYDWGYSVNFNKDSIMDWQIGCKVCKEIYTKEVLKNCDTSEIDIVECEECRADCDSFASFQVEKRISDNSIFVRNNILYILTNQGKVLLLDFDKLELQSIPLDLMLKDKKSYSAPEVIVVYDTSTILPDKFDLPTVDDGKEFETALKEYIKQDETINAGFGDKWHILVRKLVVNRAGLCEELEMEISNKDWESNVKHEVWYANRNQIKAKVEHWLMTRQYNKSSVPKGFKKYCYWASI